MHRFLFRNSANKYKRVMQLIVCRVIIISMLSIRCSCNLYLEQDKWRDQINRNVISCLDTLIAITDWAVNDFAVIFDDNDTIEFDLLQRHEHFTWKFINSKIFSGTLSGFYNVILFASNFESVKETTNEIDIRRMDTRSKYVIIVKENFEDFNDIREASTGIGPAMWKLDKTRVVYLVPHKEDILVMTYFPFVRDCEPGELEVLYVWQKKGFIKGADFFREKMLDIRGCVQNHSQLFNRRTILQGHRAFTETGESVVGGVGGKFVSIIAQKMNMKLRLSPEKLDCCNLIMDQVTRGESLFYFVSNIPFAHQLKVFDIGSGYMEECLAFGYHTKGYEVPWKNFISPLSNEVWLYTGCTFIIFCVFILLTNFVNRRSKMINFAELRLLDIFGAFLGSSIILPHGFRGRYLFSIWIFYSYLITASYNCGLVSFLTTPNEKNVINTLKELYEDGMDFGGTEYLREFYNDPSDPAMMNIYNKFKIWSINEVEEIARNGSGATVFFGSSLYSYNTNRTDVNDYIHLLKENTFTYLVPITMRRGSPFTIGVRRYASLAIQGGLQNYWYDHYTAKSRRADIETKPPTPISIQHVRGIFFLYITALIASCLIFFGEIISHKYSSIFPSLFIIYFK